MAKRPGRQRLSIDIPEKLHRALKELAFNRRTTITKYVFGAIISKLKMEMEANKSYDK